MRGLRRAAVAGAAILLSLGLIAQLTSAHRPPAQDRAASARASSSPPIRHVFTIVLENESASTTFGPGSPAPYLANTMRAEGAYLPNYFGIGHASLDNYVAMISGQAPNPVTRADCPTFVNVSPGTIGAGGQAGGAGCVYPASVPTIASQLQGAGLTWRDYNESMGADPSREAAQCGHPALGSPDHTEAATAVDQYATRHNPFVYFHSIIDNASLCDRHVVNVNLLPQDLASASATPNYVFITPDLCDDGHDATCANHSRPGGFAAINSFLSKWVPRITASPAYRQNGLLIVIFDEGVGDSRACCGEIPGPGSPLPGGNGPGGGNTGAVLLSPYIAPHTVSQVPYNHYTMLRSVENIFGLGHIGYAGLAGETPLGADVFTRPNFKPPPTCVARKLPRARRGRLPANSVISGIRLASRHGREVLIFTGVHAGELKLSLRNPKTRHLTTVNQRIAACRTYQITLLKGHETVTIVASVGHSSQRATKRY